MSTAGCLTQSMLASTDRAHQACRMCRAVGVGRSVGAREHQACRAVGRCLPGACQLPACLPAGRSVGRCTCSEPLASPYPLIVSIRLTVQWRTRCPDTRASAPTLPQPWRSEIFSLPALPQPWRLENLSPARDRNPRGEKTVSPRPARAVGSSGCYNHTPARNNLSISLQQPS